MFGNTHPRKPGKAKNEDVFSKVDFLLLKYIGVVDTLQINHWFLGSWILQVWMKRTEKNYNQHHPSLYVYVYYRYRYAKKWDLVQKNNVKERSQENPNKLQYIQLQNPETRKKIKHPRMKRPFGGTPSSGVCCCSTLSWPFCFEISSKHYEILTNL